MTEEHDAKDVFGERLRRARETRGLGQQQLADMARLPPSSISHFEAGSRKPSFDNLRRIAQALDVTTDYLLGRVNDMDRVEGADRMHRHLNKLSESDLKLADDFVKMLASRGRSESGGEK